MKNIVLTFSVFSIALMFSACSKNNSTPANSASVMFVNACNGSANMDTKVGGSSITAASNIAYFKNSGYQNVTAGAVDINFYLTAQGTPLCNGTATLTAGNHYSVFAGGIVTAPIFVIASDDLTAPGSGNTKIRFINLSTDSLNESLFVGNQKLDSNVAYGAYTPFVEVSSATAAAVLVQDPLKPTKLASITNQAFQAGKIYTVMISGTSSAGTGTGGLTLTVMSNN